MVETTYYEDKVYLPREIRDKLGIVEGDVLHIEIIEKGVAKLSVVRGCSATKKAIAKLDDPPNLGKVEKLSREELYEDIT